MPSQAMDELFYNVTLFIVGELFVAFCVFLFPMTLLRPVNLTCTCGVEASSVALVASGVRRTQNCWQSAGGVFENGNDALIAKALIFPICIK